MYAALNAGDIGVKTAGLAELDVKAKSVGFKGAEFWAPEAADLADKEGIAAVKALFDRAGVTPAGWGLPTDWRKDDATFQADLAKLPRIAKTAAALGATRTFTWILSWDDHRPFAENRKFH